MRWMHFTKFEYLLKFEFIFEKALAPSSGAQDACFNDKNRGSKISWHCPLKKYKGTIACTGISWAKRQSQLSNLSRHFLSRVYNQGVYFVFLICRILCYEAWYEVDRRAGSHSQKEMAPFSCAGFLRRFVEKRKMESFLSSTLHIKTFYMVDCGKSHLFLRFLLHLYSFLLLKRCHFW
jgi:hypothetical protein